MSKTTEQITDNLLSLATNISIAEKALRAKGLPVPERPDAGDMAWSEPKLLRATYDDLLAAESVLEGHCAKLRVDVRLNTPLASASVSASRTPGSLQTTQRIVAAGGGKACTLKAEIQRLESELPSLKGTTRKAVEAKLATAKGELAKLGSSGK